MESSLQKNLKDCVNHLNMRKLKFDIANFPLKKTIYKVFNVHSKKLKRKFKETIELLGKKKKNCDICNKQIEEFHASLLYEIDVLKWAIRFIKIEACCSKCYNIKTFPLFQNEIYKNMQVEGLINFSPIYDHYYTVNNLKKENELLLQNDINVYFTCAVLMKNVKWIYVAVHKTLDDFLAYSLNEEGRKETRVELKTSKEKTTSDQRQVASTSNRKKTSQAMKDMKDKKIIEKNFHTEKNETNKKKDKKTIKNNMNTVKIKKSIQIRVKGSIKRKKMAMDNTCEKMTEEMLKSKKEKEKKDRFKRKGIMKQKKESNIIIKETQKKEKVKRW